MDGKENGVQARIRSNYPLAVFVHCSAHRLNRVVNGLNAVVDIRNTIGTVKAIIKFFRESPKRRPLVPNTPLLCETRWSAKYKSMKFFAENFTKIHKQLKHLALHDSNANGRQNAHNLRTASETPVFMVTLLVIAQYSSILEPVTQALQSVHVDMLCVKQHVDKLLLLFDNHRKNAEKYFAEDIYAPSLTTAEEIGVTISLPRQCDRQVHRANIGGTTEEYYRRSIYVPFMDSLIQSLKSRLSETNTPAFTFYKLHPAQLEKANRLEYKALVQTIQQFYSFDNFEQEAISWYDMQKQGLLSQSENLKELDFIDLVRHIQLYPGVRQAFITLLTLPAATCTVERSFSTLRRVKTWLRTTMSDDRLSGLCLMSVHRSRINSDKKSFMQKVIDNFGKDPRRLHFLFKN